MSFPAAFPGTCRKCHEDISPGDMIELVGSEALLPSHYAHEVCPDVSELDRDAKRPVCPNCFMLKPCECDDA